MNSSHCCACGKHRGISQIRESWGLQCPIVCVPLPPEKEGDQYNHQYIANASVFRNGGSGSNTHICDECLLVGLRYLKVEISKLIGELDVEHSRDERIVALTKQLTNIQHAHQNICYDHDRMQDRLAHVLGVLDKAGVKSDETVEYARWEVKRGHVQFTSKNKAITQ